MNACAGTQAPVMPVGCGGGWHGPGGVGVMGREGGYDDAH